MGEPASDINRLEELRQIRREANFDPFRVIIEEIQRKPSKQALKVADRVRAAEALARIELDYEKLEEAKKQRSGRGMRMSVGPDGAVQAELFEFDDLGQVSDDQLESRIADKIKALGIDPA